jgi:methylenetetrahydrofolate reductase (NADPH)
VDKVRKAGIRCRVIPGIIPITSYSQIDRFAKLSGTKIPKIFTDKLESAKDNPKRILRIGVDYAIEQCRDLLDNGAPGIHFYTLNKSNATVEIFEAIR